MRKHFVVLSIGLLVLAAGALAHQAEQKQELPAGWKVRVDRADASAADVKFWNMAPGWHTTTGPAAILYNPANTASGEYHLESESFLFPGEHLEGFGVFFGGKNLDQDSQSYVYFLIRKDGQFIVKLREGAATRTLIPWTEHAAIAKHPGQGDVKNVLSVHAGTQVVEFYVNSQRVGSLPRAQVPADGVVGLRINHHLNVHVTTLTVQSAAGGKQEFAPKRPAKQ